MTLLDTETRRWLAEPRFWTMGTVNPDGSPQLTPMWVGLEIVDGAEYVVVNTSVGRVKQENLSRDARLSLACFDTDNPYDRMEIRGRAVGYLEGAEAIAVMDRLAQKYLSVEKFPWLVPGEQRLAVLIEPDRVHHTIGVEPFRPGVLPSP
ncbi:TIGR03618 family F420-dependent PPOX class oxidoreductase [Nocardia sp. NBC_01327]|uniref:TIGR03618 family F420-dependent PPOX class oxidoreductase n=1 Tax=Nocardia sp. NBC_01327 TaxID=2903593 RepID=UPI002E14654F|nr:TIGR03618 family F420-dependent PPOX class oxidoreductase [Nocardia sp. NBC_01327]